MEQIVRQTLDQFGFSDPGRSGEDEGHRLVLSADTRAVAFDCTCHGGNGAILPDDMRLQALFQLVHLFKFAFGDGGCRDSRPDLHDLRKVCGSQRNGFAILFQLAQTGCHLQFLGFDSCQLFVLFLLVLRVCRLAGNALQLLALLPELKQFVADFIRFVQRCRGQGQARCSLIQQINRFIR